MRTKYAITARSYARVVVGETRKAIGTVVLLRPCEPAALRGRAGLEFDLCVTLRL